MYIRESIREAAQGIEELDCLQELGLESVKDTVSVDAWYGENYAARFEIKKYLAWKVLRDPYYRLMAVTGESYASIRDAGFVPCWAADHWISLITIYV